jgi:hypothetical protein
MNGKPHPPAYRQAGNPKPPKSPKGGKPESEGSNVKY